jgi:hypothetical protein
LEVGTIFTEHRPCSFKTQIPTGWLFTRPRKQYRSRKLTGHNLFKSMQNKEHSAYGTVLHSKWRISAVWRHTRRPILWVQNTQGERGLNQLESSEWVSQQGDINVTAHGLTPLQVEGSEDLGSGEQKNSWKRDDGESSSCVRDVKQRRLLCTGELEYPKH